nr:hypothetical protein [Sediminibacillus halophilus]
MEFVCPNCGGELVKRRGTNKLLNQYIIPKINNRSTINSKKMDQF